MNLLRKGHIKRIVLACTVVVTALVLAFLFITRVSPRHDATQPESLDYAAQVASDEPASEEPGEAILDHADREIDNMLDKLDPLRQREWQQRAEAETETVEQTARNLLQFEPSLSLATPLVASAELFLEKIRALPRVRRLLRIAARGEAEKEKVLKCVAEMCRVYVEELPDFSPPGEGWEPQASSAQGGMAYAYLLGELDDNAATLDLVVRMHLRQQSARRNYHTATHGLAPPLQEDSSKLIGCAHGTTLAYACDRFLSLYCSREDLRRNATPEQIEVLERFSKYQQERSEREWDYYWDQRKILGFATDFVQRGGVEGEV